MKTHSDQKIQQIKDLRRKGMGINEIVSVSGVPKTTVWHHIHKINLTDYQKATLRAKQGGSNKRRLESIKIAEKKAISILNGASRERVQMIAMLYWAEGHKKSGCHFTNTDGRMIAFYLKILREDVGVPETQISVTIRIFTGMSEKESLDYWSSITQISSKNIRVRMNDGGNSGRTKYGMCLVTVLKGHSFLKLMHALIGQISKDMLD